MARKREKTETDGTGFGILAVEEACAAVEVAGDGVVEGTAVRDKELFSGVTATRVGDDEFCVTPAAEARLVLPC